MSSRNDKLPALRRHKATNRARLRVRGRDIYGPDWGRGKRPTEEWYLDLIARWGRLEVSCRKLNVLPSPRPFSQHRIQNVV